MVLVLKYFKIDCEYGNKLILNDSGITSSEWFYNKKSINIYPARPLAAKSQDGPLCRYEGCSIRKPYHIFLDSVRKMNYWDVNITTVEQLLQTP